MEQENKVYFNKDTFKMIPWWGWIFVILSSILPLLTLGGAIPMVLAMLSVGACIRILLSLNMKMPLKILSCSGIIGLEWCVGLFICIGIQRFF